jgi:DNA-binding GntR family transcriptional regulator
MADNSSSNEKLRGKHPTEEIIYQRLVNAIIDKRLRPGQHLNEVKLAESFDIPRSRVRRVLERLRDEDVIEIRLHHGAFVSRPTVEDAKYVFEARRHLENLVIQLVCERATSNDIESLRKLLVESARRSIQIGAMLIEWQPNSIYSWHILRAILSSKEWLIS